MEIARNLDKSRFNVHIITLSNYVPLMPEEDPLRRSLHCLEKRSRFDPWVLFRLLRRLRTLNVDVIHSFAFDAELATRLVGRLAGAKLIIGSERSSNYAISSWRWLINSLTLPLTDLIVANSESGARYHARLYRRSLQQYRILYNGIDIERFAPQDQQACRQRLGIGRDKFVVGVFASFKPPKNHLALFKAVAQLTKVCPDLIILLAGDTLYGRDKETSAYRSELEQVIVDNDLQPFLLMLGNREDVENVYPACDLTVLPSLREGTPNVVLESLACGVPVIATDISDNATLIRDGGNGFLVKPGDTDSLRDRILTLYTNPTLLSGMRDKARESIVNRYSNDAMLESVTEIYSDLDCVRAQRLLPKGT